MKTYAKSINSLEPGDCREYQIIPAQSPEEQNKI